MFLAGFSNLGSGTSDRQGRGQGQGKDQSGKDSTNSVAAVANAIATHRLGAKIARGMASGIGLASESVHHHKAKGQKQIEEETYNDNTWNVADLEAFAEYQADISRQMHEAAWELDEAQDQVRSEEELPAYNEHEARADSYLANHPTYQTESKKLAMPVLLTQRRPGKRSRGFVRAYAPCLNDVGINLVTFLDLIDRLNEAIIPSGLIQALNLASLAGIAAPEPFTVLISLSILIATNIGDEIHSRTKTNKFLDEINESFFTPRGLVPLVLTWKPNQAHDMLTTVDMNKSVEKAAIKNQDSSRRKFQSSSGALPFEWPETAPLVFPVLDDLAKSEDAKKPAIKRAGKFVEGYMDKRARMKWAGKNPDSKMANAGPKEEFRSRYADPNHPASSGDVLALLTGGNMQTGKLVSYGIDAVTGGRSKTANAPDEQETYDPYYGQYQALNQIPHEQPYSQTSCNQTYDQIYNQASYSQPYPQPPYNDPYSQTPNQSNNKTQPQSRNRSLPPRGGLALSLISGVKNIFQSDVLYLMIVNRPTQEEIESSKAYMSQL